LKIAIINTYNVKDVKIWAGTPFYISSMLEKLLGKENVFCIEIPEMKRDLTSYLSGFYLNRVVKKKYFSWADTRLLKKNKKKYAGDLTKKFDRVSYTHLTLPTTSRV
jgi:2-hydroxy-3-keto-5-methylthiopentenyl-1-phosphate phosphatase